MIARALVSLRLHFEDYEFDPGPVVYSRVLIEVEYMFESSVACLTIDLFG